MTQPRIWPLVVTNQGVRAVAYMDDSDLSAAMKMLGIKRFARGKSTYLPPTRQGCTAHGPRAYCHQCGNYGIVMLKADG